MQFNLFTYLWAPFLGVNIDICKETGVKDIYLHLRTQSFIIAFEEEASMEQGEHMFTQISEDSNYTPDWYQEEDGTFCICITPYEDLDRSPICKDLVTMVNGSFKYLSARYKKSAPSKLHSDLLISEDPGDITYYYSSKFRSWIPVPLVFLYAGASKVQEVLDVTGGVEIPIHTYGNYLGMPLKIRRMIDVRK